MRMFLLLLLVIGLAVLVWKWNYLVGLLSMSRHQQYASAEQANQLGAAAGVNGQRILVAYFSWGGNTRKLAHEIHAKVGGDIFEIRTKDQHRYPDDYKSATIVARKEFADDNRPELAETLANAADYDVLLLGFPIWWHTAPMAVQVFLESHDFAGKTIVPFATSGGDTIDSSLPTLQKLAPRATFGEAITANSRLGVNGWLKRNGLAVKE